MGKVGLKSTKYECFTEEQQSYYDKLTPNKQRYVDFRGQGHTKSDAYKMAGYSGNASAQAAYVLERRDKAMTELINVMLKARRAKEVAVEKSPINQTIDALAKQQTVEKMLATVDNCDGETARRIQFYRDILTGKIKTVRKTKRFDGSGHVIDTKVEEVDDVSTRIQARKELDKILGLNEIVDLGNLQMGDITVCFVDASKKDELEDDRNKIEMDIDRTEVIDGETVLVAKEVEVNAPKGSEETEEQGG